MPNEQPYDVKQQFGGVGKSLDELLAQSKQPSQETPQPSLQDLFAQGGVTSSQPLPGAGMGSTEGLRQPRSDPGSFLGQPLGAESKSYGGATTDPLSNPEFARESRMRELGGFMSSFAGTEEQRKGWATELASVQKEQEAARAARMEETRPTREQQARVEAEKGLSPMRMKEEAEKSRLATEQAKAVVSAQSAADIAKMRATPFQTGLLAGKTMGDIEKDPKILLDYIQRLTGAEVYKGLPQLLQALSIARNQMPGLLGATEAEQHNTTAVLIAGLQSSMTGTPLSQFLKPSINRQGQIVFIPDYTSLAGGLLPGLSPGGVPEINQRGYNPFEGIGIGP